MTKILIYYVINIFFSTLSNVLPVESTSNELNISHDNDTSNDEQVDVENIEESQLSDPPPVSVSKINEREKNKKLPAAASNIDKVLEHLNKKQKITHTALDPVEMLMLSYAKTIKTFSPIRQAIAKKKISEIISDLEIEEIAENEQNKRYYSHTENYHRIPSHSQDPDPYLYPAVQDSEQNAINLTVEQNHFGDKYSNNSSFDNRYTQL